MARLVTAMRYAQAAFEIAKEENKLNQWQADLDKIGRLVGDDDIYGFLVNPKINRAKKMQVIKENLKGAEPKVLNMVYVLISKGKVNTISDIVKEFERLRNRDEGVEEVEVATAIALDNNEQKTLIEKLSKMTGNKIVLKTKVDPTLVSGIVVRIGDKLIDGCLKSKLKTMHKQLSEGNI